MLIGCVFADAIAIVNLCIFFVSVCIVADAIARLRAYTLNDFINAACLFSVALYLFSFSLLFDFIPDASSYNSNALGKQAISQQNDMIAATKFVTNQ